MRPDGRGGNDPALARAGGAAQDLKSAPDPVLSSVLDLNRTVEAMTSPLDMARLRQLVDWATLAEAVIEEGTAQAFLMGFAPGSPYDSPNYRWFAARYPRFAYVDRVVVAEGARGRGLARALYARLAAHARRYSLGPLVCEVNTDPPNPGSDAFHAALGFGEVGQAQLGPAKSVRYLLRPEAD